MKNFKDLTQSNLWQIPAPEGLYNKTFNDLFMFLLDKNLVALALYRLPGATDNRFPYVWTYPDSATITNQDRVFVLGEKIPKDLNLNYEDINQNENNFQLRNQYIFGHNSEGDIVKNYYGVEPDINEEDSKYASESSNSSDEEIYQGKKGGKASMKIQFSKLGDQTASQAEKSHALKENYTDSAYEKDRLNKSNLDYKSKDTGFIETQKDTRQTAVSTKNNAVNEANQNQSSIMTTKTIIDNLASKIDLVKLSGINVSLFKFSFGNL
jgi:hypothetical protein